MLAYLRHADERRYAASRRVFAMAAMRQMAPAPTRHAAARHDERRLRLMLRRAHDFRLKTQPMPADTYRAVDRFAQRHAGAAPLFGGAAMSRAPPRARSQRVDVCRRHASAMFTLITPADFRRWLPMLLADYSRRY